MAAIRWDDVGGPNGFATELAVVPPTAQIVILSVVNGTGLAADNFGGEEADLTKTARILLAAHMGTLVLRQGLGGAIASQSEGGASQSYWNAWINPRALHLTSYGQMLMGIISGTPARAGILVG